jgi:hypothetical protein
MPLADRAFFRWIKQYLRIKSFYGTSENAVKTQIWTAVSVYLLVAIIKKRLNLETSLYTFLQILSVTAFEKIPILQVLTQFVGAKHSEDSCNQLELFKLYWDTRGTRYSIRKLSSCPPNFLPKILDKKAANLGLIE